jgi:hypothetical protein
VQEPELVEVHAFKVQFGHRASDTSFDKTSARSAVSSKTAPAYAQTGRIRRNYICEIQADIPVLLFWTCRRFFNICGCAELQRKQGFIRTSVLRFFCKEYKMSSVEASLRRLQNSFSGFLATSNPLQDVSALKAQIELRERVLQDIALIRSRLATFLRSDKELARRRLRTRRAGRARLAESYRAGRVRSRI